MEGGLGRSSSSSGSSRRLAFRFEMEAIRCTRSKTSSSSVGRRAVLDLRCSNETETGVYGSAGCAALLEAACVAKASFTTSAIRSA